MLNSSPLKKLADLLKEFGPEALRACLTAMIPAFLIGYYYHVEYAVPFLIAAMNASMTDFPGRKTDKLKIAGWGIVSSTVTALVIGLLLPFPFLLIGTVALAAGIFSLFNALGQRIAMVGVTNLFMITFTMGLQPQHPVLFALFVFFGTAFYHCIIFIHFKLDPAWDLKRAIAISYLTTAKLIRTKAKYYNTKYALEQLSQEVTRLNIILAEQHEVIRYLILQENNDLRHEKQYILWTRAYQLMDLCSLTTASNNNFTTARIQLAKRKLLDTVSDMIIIVAEWVENYARSSKDDECAIRQHLERLHTKLDVLENHSHTPPNDIPLIRDLINNTRAIIQILRKPPLKNDSSLINSFFYNKIDYSHFVVSTKHSILDINKHIQSFSPVFAFALRLSFLFLAGGIIGLLLSDMKYTYWIFMTIIVVARPSFSITLKRNMERLTGTLAGVITGCLLSLISQNIYISIVLSGVFLFCFLLFNRRHYLVSVVFITSSVVVAFHLTEPNLVTLATSRVLFSIIGCMLAVIGWFLFPIRMNGHIDLIAQKAHQENNDYFNAVLAYLESPTQNLQLQVRLTRKRAFTSLTKLSETCLQLKREPGLTEDRLKNMIRDETHYNQYHARISNLLINQDNAAYLKKAIKT
ncbi:FUSC family membrane protein [Sphingobacterium sp.]|uniref:FUSC family protein n=2 Tax=Sphingobacterium sp. TaxID=341027 RepID=UPI00289C532C|nr:FUSC family membrane protein [Sphingobacterium sp.]